MFLTENLQTEVADSYDVIVIGGGVAGASAAIAAARSGAKTLVVEKCQYLGGMWTGGLVNPVFDYGNKSGGLIVELVSDLKKDGNFGGMWNACFSYEPMKRLLENKLFEAGGKVLYDTRFVRALTEKNRVTGVVLENIEGRKAYLAKTVVDCSGDATAAVSAGAKTLLGRESDGLCQAITLMFSIGNVQFLQDSCDDLANFVQEALQKQDTGYRLPYTRPYIIQLPASDTAVVQLTHMRGISPLSAWDLSSAMVEGRKQAKEAVAFFQKYIPRFHDIVLLETAPLLGVRESRRIVGDYILTKDDLVLGKHYEDDVTNAGFGIDIHNPTDDKQECCPVKSYGIPYRSLLPQGIDGMLVAGKCISGTSEAMASYRVTGNCCAMGEAAGKAAAYAVKNKVSLREVPPCAYQLERPSRK